MVIRYAHEKQKLATQTSCFSSATSFYPNLSNLLASYPVPLLDSSKKYPYYCDWSTYHPLTYPPKKTRFNSRPYEGKPKVSKPSIKSGDWLNLMAEGDDGTAGIHLQIHCPCGRWKRVLRKKVGVSVLRVRFYN